MTSTLDSHATGDLLAAQPLETVAERLAQGRSLRRHVPRSAHAAWSPPANRPDPVALLEASSQGRLPQLIPIRYGRMLASPFAFYRGAPLVMAHDLAATPVTGINVQLCGDAHLRNFGLYASPERQLLFDINDFDETHPGPWEWDVKRLASSFVVAGRANGFRDEPCMHAAQIVARSYRKHMRRYARMRLLDIWYSRVDADAALALFRRGGGASLARDMAKARQRNNLHALSRLAEPVDGSFRIRDNPPLVTHVDDQSLADRLRRFFHLYRGTLQEDRRHLLERYRFADYALKVVGVGSVGTRCYIALLTSNQEADPLFLQIKEARPSVLEPHLPKSRYENQGHRVVNGQRLMQSASDIFLGWSRDPDGDYYVRQLRDMKGAAEVEVMTTADLAQYASLCGWTLARAHARSGDAAPIAGYLGKSEKFEDAIAAFARAYSDQTQRDYEAFQAAVRQGGIMANADLEPALTSKNSRTK